MFGRFIGLVSIVCLLLFGGEAMALASSFQVMEKTNVFESRGDQFLIVSQLEAGVVLPYTKETTNYFLVAAGGSMYYVPKISTATTVDTVNVEQHVEGSYPREVVAAEEAELYTKEGEPIGNVQKGKRVVLHMLADGRGVIEFLRHRFYVDLTQFTHINQVHAQKNISYEEMAYHLRVFSLLYPEWTRLEEIGQSVEGRVLYALHVGTGKKQLLLDAAIHAREHMTTNVLLEMIDEYSRSYILGTNYGSYNTRALLDNVTLTFIPMLNPDGVTLVQGGYKAIKNGAAVQKWNGRSSVTRWKANARGIDLNRNFDPGTWASLQAAKTPAFKNSKGPQPYSEPESLALRDFVRAQNFSAYLSYHSSGQVIYYHYNQQGAQHTRDLTFAKKVAKATGYMLMSPIKNVKTGTSQAWFIAEFKKPALTIEISPYVVETVVPLSNWPRIWKQQQYVGLLAAKEM